MASPGPPTTARGLSVRQLTFIFFGFVAVCAVFFAFGFVLGRNPGASREGPSVEQVAPHSEIPPTVNPPAQDVPPPASAPASNPGSSSVLEQDLKAGSGQSAAAPAAASAQSARPETSSPPRSTPAYSGPPPAHAALRGIMVQVAASHTERHAQSLVRTLRAHGYRARLIVPRRGDNIYRVQVGPFSSRREAVRVLHRLGREGFKPFIKRD